MYHPRQSPSGVVLTAGGGGAAGSHQAVISAAPALVHLAWHFGKLLGGDCGRANSHNGAGDTRS